MKAQRLSLVVISLAALTHGIRARADIIGTFDENGNGKSVYTVTGVSAPIMGTNGIDPSDPTNGLTPLVYDLGIQNTAMTDGDIQLTAPGSSDVTDLFRFYTDTSTSQNLLIVYSLVGGGNLASVGIPVGRQSNLLTLEKWTASDGSIGVFGYQPTTVQPGFVDIQAGGFTGNILYNLVTYSAIPEPSSVILLGVGTTAAVVARHRLRARRRARDAWPL